MEKQIELLKKYNIKNYTVEGGRITINGGLWLMNLTTAPEGFLSNTVINGCLNLRSLTIAPKGFLRGATMNGDLWLNLLTTSSKDFLRGATINGWLYLNSLTEFPKDLFNDAIIKSRGLFLNAKMAIKTIVKNIYKIHQI